MLIVVVEIVCVVSINCDDEIVSVTSPQINISEKKVVCGAPPLLVSHHL